MAQQGGSAAAFEKENVAKKWPQQNATWERGDRGWERPRLGGMPAELAFAAAALCLQVSNASHGTEMVIARNQKMVGIQKIWKHFLLNRSTESKDFRKRKDTIKK